MTPETLVWKLAARVQYAASGEDTVRPDHKFLRAELTDLFELFVQQLHKFPSIPEDYRPQDDEPHFRPDHRVQMVIGFSGAGKTLWSSWQAHHISAESAYFDVGDLSGSALAGSVARELAARFISGKGTGSAQLPVGTGLETLRYIAQAIDLSEPPFVVVDNIHRVEPEHLRQVVEACPTVRFVLIGQPWPQLARLEGLLNLVSIQLSGWDIDTVAEVFACAGSKITPAAARGWRQLTSGLPLYVQNAARLCTKLFSGDATCFLKSVHKSSHPVDLAQEAILELVVENLTEDEKHVMAALSLAQSQLTEEECHCLVSKIPRLDDHVGPTLRALGRKGLVQTFADGSRKLHDALYVLSRRLLEHLDVEMQQALRCQLRDILFLSLQRERDLTRLGAWLRLLGPTGRVDILVDIASSEMFHELGDPSDLKEILIHTANSAAGDGELEFWALDSIVFWELQEDQYDRNPEPYLTRLEALVADGSFSARQQVAVIVKRMMTSGMKGDYEAVERAFQLARPLFENDVVMSRIARYNYATAMFHARAERKALQTAEELYEEYYELIGIDVLDVVGANPATMKSLAGDRIDEIQDDLKHLADCLTLAAMCKRRLGEHTRLLGIHAAKFYQLAGSYRSEMKVAQDMAGDFVAMGDVTNALKIMESSVVPLLNRFGFDGQMMDVRGQYAVILAHNGRFSEARSEMDAIESYVDVLPLEYQMGIRNQRGIIESLANTRKQGDMGRGQRGREMGRFGIAKLFRNQKIGRNAPCPCGSGRKFKKCCGSQS